MLQRRIKKVVSVILGVIMTVTPIANTYAIGGSGSFLDPYRINNTEDLQEVLGNIEENKNWSNGKYFVLAPIIMQLLVIQLNSVLHGNSKERVFNGRLNGYCHTLILSNKLFDKIGKEGRIENLNIVSSRNGYLGGVNEGEIESCRFEGVGAYGVIGNNYGVIKDCEIEGKFSNGIASNNYGRIERCIVRGEISNAGLVSYNEAKGKILNCKVKASVKGTNNVSGLVNNNKGIVENCTARVVSEGNNKNLYYLINQNGVQKEAIARRCVVGEGSKGAYMEQMFGSIGNVKECGYEGWDQKDYSNIYERDAETKEKKGIKKKEEEPEIKFESEEKVLVDVEEEKESNVVTAVKDVALGLVSALYDNFVSGTVHLLTWLPNKIEALKEGVSWIRETVDAPSEYMESLTTNPQIYQASKLGGDIACLFIGVKGIVTAVKKSGKLIKLGRMTTKGGGTVAEGFGKVIHIDFGGQVPEGYKIVGNTVKVVEPQSMMIIEDELEAQHALGKLKNVIQLRKSGIIKKVAKTAGYVASTGGSGYNTVNDISGSDNKPNIQEQPKKIIKVNNMNEFFETEFGKTLKSKSIKTHYVENGCPVYEVTEKTGNPHLDKGDYFYLDKTHGDHIEVFNHAKKPKSVIRIDGSLNIEKTTKALNDNRVPGFK